jgi:hypothetical protein
LSPSATRRLVSRSAPLEPCPLDPLLPLDPPPLDPDFEPDRCSPGWPCSGGGVVVVVVVVVVEVVVPAIGKR